MTDTRPAVEDEQVATVETPDLARARAAALGITLEGSFACVLPGHQHRARLEWSAGFWTYRCPGLEPQPFGWADIRAAQAYGEVQTQLSRAELNRWAQRVDHDAGLLAPVAISIPVPEDSGALVHVLAGDLALYLGLRVAGGGFGQNEPFTYTKRFRRAYSRAQITGDQARDGWRKLKHLGIVEDTGERVGKGWKAILWQLGRACRAELPVELGVSSAVPGDALVLVEPPAVEGVRRGPADVTPDERLPLFEECEMNRTEVRQRGEVRMRATRDWAMLGGVGLGGHDPEAYGRPCLRPPSLGRMDTVQICCRGGQAAHQLFL